MFGRLWHKMQVFFRWVSIWITRIIRFLTHDIWLLNEEDFSRWKGHLVKDAKTVLLMLNTFNDQKIDYQITALAYRSMMAVVPFIAIGLYLTDTVGLRDHFADIVYANLGEGEVTQILLNAADNITNTAETGLFGFISMASFTWIVLSLMLTVSRVFNNVWKVERVNQPLRTFGIIVGITLLSPFVIMLFFSGSVLYSNALSFLFPDSTFLAGHIRSLLTWLVFAATTVFVLHIMYRYIPDTKVHSRYSLKAALIAGLIFTGVQYLYLETQLMVAKQSAIYGVFAAVPLFMIWLNMGWSIVLYGAELSYAFQNVDQHSTTVEMLDEMNADAVRARKERRPNEIKL